MRLSIVTDFADVIGQLFLFLGAGVILGVCGLFIWASISMWRERDQSMSVDDECDDYWLGADEPVTEVTPPRIADMSLEQLMDESIHANATVKAIERQVCRLFEIKQEDGSDLFDSIYEAVHDGRNWPVLFSEFNKRRYGTRWDSSTRRASSVV